MKVPRLYLGLGALLGASAAVLVAANAIDCYRFHHALNRAQNLSAAELIAIGDFCRTAKQHERFEADQAPTAFHPLKPLSGFLYRGSSDLLLYRLEEVYLYLHVSTSPNNQRISYFTNSSGPQKTKKLWDRNPEFVRRVSPSGRLVTLTRWRGSEARQWIVLEDKICVVDSSGRVGSEDVLQASVPLTAEGHERIVRNLHALEPADRGKDYRAPVADGVSLHFTFTPTGETGPDDIAISNTWIEEVRPLIDSISTLGPKEYPVDFEKLVAWDEARKLGATFSVRTLRESAAQDWPEPKTPWWCVWRRFVRSS